MNFCKIITKEWEQHHTTHTHTKKFGAQHLRMSDKFKNFLFPAIEKKIIVVSSQIALILIYLSNVHS